MQTFDFTKTINRKGTYSTQWDYIADRFGTADLLPFTISDMDFEVAPCIKEALQKRVEHGVFGYSRWNHDDFKNAIGNWFKTRFDTIIDKEKIAYSPSIIYSVARLIEYYSNENDSVIIQSPAYDSFFNTITGLKRKVLSNNLIYDDKGIAQIDFNQLEQQAKQAKIILLCNPHNPTGRAWTQTELQKILDISIKNNLAIISDDAHMDIAFSPNIYTPIAKIWKNYEKAAIATSTAKGFNTASIGGSYVIFNNTKDKDAFITDLKVRGLSSAPILFVMATIAAYTGAHTWLDTCLKALKGNLLFIDEFLKKNIPAVTIAPPQATYFAWINVGGLKLSSKELQEKLINKGKVAIMSGEMYKQTNPQYLRLNAACPISKIEEGMSRFLKAM